MQVLDPSELEFPFKGRTLFESVKSEIKFEMRHTVMLVSPNPMLYS